jgi:predicted metal-dependent hydrolase
MSTQPPLKARAVRFDWSRTPLHWIPGDPYAAHLVNGLHLIAPPAERWFIRVYQEALPLITDEALKADVRGFMGQEGMHARAHALVLDQLRTHGIDTDAWMARFEAVCATLYGETSPIPLPSEGLLWWRLALVAAGEQMTCVLGDWILETDGLATAGADATMMELLRWHGAEEVEHRSVAFDLLKHLAGPMEYPLRVAAMATVAPLLVVMWADGVQDLVAQDEALQGRPFGVDEFLRLVRAGRSPGWEIPAAAIRFLDPFFHPAREGSMEKAAAVLATSPGGAVA